MRLHQAVEACVATCAKFTRSEWADEDSMVLTVGDDDDGIAVVRFVDGAEFVAHAADLTATDYYMLPPPSVAVTRAQLYDAIKFTGVMLNVDTFAAALCKELGL